MMKYFTHKKHWLYIIVVLAIIIGLILVRVSLTRSITVILDEVPFTIRTSALKVSGALKAAGATVIDEDQIDPPLNEWLGKRNTIRVTTAQHVTVKTQQGEYELITPERIPANILSDLGFDLFPQDQVLLNGEVVDPLSPLEIQDGIVLQYQPAVQIDIEIDAVAQTIYTNQSTLGAALEAASIPIGPQDWVSMDLTTPVDRPISVTIHRAQPLTVIIGSTSFKGQTAATSVGRALMDIGLPLQNMDFSVPDEEAPIPEDRVLEIVRVSEDVIIATDEIAYESEYVEDPETVLDQYSVVQTGRVGIYATRERVQYANGEETRRIAEGTWQASDAQTEVLGYGTRVEIRTEVVDGIT
ncbi:MAG: ubiquitin-like domain-containing protein, partial [Chloroflexota bacterium]|nr:ubiquitin-like domain-containing protein [Chloroflexota bacterium]